MKLFDLMGAALLTPARLRRADRHGSAAPVAPAVKENVTMSTIATIGTPEAALIEAAVSRGLTPEQAQRRVREFLMGARPPQRVAAAPTVRVTPVAAPVPTPPRVRDRDVVWGEIERAAFAARKPGQTDPEAIDAFLMTPAGARLYGEYRYAPAPGAARGPGGAAALFDRHRATALAGRKPGEHEAEALSRWYRANPAAYQAYRSAMLVDQRGY